MTTSLYRHFADDGALLYVGISLSWPSRTKAHAHGSRWFDQVAKVEIERFPTREAALDAERQAIKSEGPKFNVVHNRGGTPDKPEEWSRPRNNDPLLRSIEGPDVILGPVLNYRDDLLSIIVAQGSIGQPGSLVEVVLGRWAGEVPDWAYECAVVMTLRAADEITLTEARQVRGDILGKLKKHFRSVEVVETDIALAVANATQFPSAKARQILDEVAVERAETVETYRAWQLGQQGGGA